MAKHRRQKGKDTPRPQPVEPHDIPAPCPQPALDPFATFTEWASEEDTAGYANL